MKGILIFFALTLSPLAFSQTAGKCKTLDELIRKISSKKRYNFSSVNKIYNLNRTLKCDGAYAEGMSNIVVQALVMDYVRTLKVAGKTQSATDFVLSHIAAIADKAYLVKVVDNSMKICPRNKKELCKKIETEARKGIK
ncbi:MAG: hypothetical protein H7336_00210 [Bacteriovorax sp.]|nr:hypothetical protein [Bacteriovorax sp.]